MAKRILLLGGGTGGHVFPLVAVADALRVQVSQQNMELELLAIGNGTFMASACAEHNIPFKSILAGKLRRYFSPLIIMDILKWPLSFLQSLWYLFWFMPDLVFAKGGYAAFWPAVVARLYVIPLVIHESDAMPGIVNRRLGIIANNVLLAFASSAKFFNQVKVAVVGNPVRKELLIGDKSAGLQTFQLTGDKKIILVTGGSQGAKVINDIILESLPQLVSKFQIIHQCGESQFPAVKAEVDRLTKEGESSYGQVIAANYRLYTFFNMQELTTAYAVADIIVSRAGASNLFEISALGKPAVIIPIKDSANDHQLANALEFQKYGASVIEEPNLTSHILINQIEYLLQPEHYQTASEAIKKFATPDAADKIAQILLQ